MSLKSVLASLYRKFHIHARFPAFGLSARPCGNKRKENMTTRRYLWKPLEVMQGVLPHYQYAIVILNEKLIDYVNLVSLWDNAKLRVTVDGGTNHCHEFLQRNPAVVHKFPDMITGDFDSVEPCLLDLYKKQGSLVIPTPDQDETDYTKSLREISAFIKDKEFQLHGITTLVENSGRMDHIMANINTLFIAPSILNVPVYLLSSNALSWLLWPGKHQIQVSEEFLSSWCGLIPIGMECPNVSTQGLKWNLEKQTLKFGGLVSTSNTYSGEENVTVETEKPLLWSMSLPHVK